jgi:hypothetical protein
MSAPGLDETVHKTNILAQGDRTGAELRPASRLYGIARGPALPARSFVNRRGGRMISLHDPYSFAQLPS